MNTRQSGTDLSHQELNAKQACPLAFIVSNKVHIVTMIASDLNCVIILININLDTMIIPKSGHKSMIDTYRIMINICVKIS